MQFNRLHIGTRLTVGFATVLTLLLISVIAANLVNRRNSSLMVAGITLANSKMTQANIMQSSLLEAGLAMRNIGMLAETAAMEQEKARVQAQQKRYEQARATLAELGLDSTEQQAVEDVGRLTKEMDAALEQAYAQAVAFNPEAAGRIITGKIEPLNQRALAEIRKLQQAQEAAAAVVLKSSVSAGESWMNLLLGVAALGLVIGAVVAWMITRSIVVPLQGAVSLAKRVAAGDLRSRVTVLGSDEISELLHALQDMNDSLFRTVSEVRRGTDSITGASGDIASGNADLAERTDAQASALAQTRQTMAALTDAVRENAASAQQADGVVRSASEHAVRGGEVVHEVVQTMGAIKESSSRIADITSVIDGIAFQTNILALNAAVEAARAGDQGRGFAVVAAEVRTLAQRSASAAKEIKQLITDSVEKVDAGGKLVDAAGRSMDDIVASVKRVADIMGKIAASSTEQRAGIEAVDVAIEQMDEMTQRNAALVEEASAAAQSMRDQAKTLVRTVSAFELGQGDVRVFADRPVPHGGHARLAGAALALPESAAA
ncbi:methyl-accepting chemotaxis protein [Ramlibacter monticola]|uniref:HAMP domain-containing protein n=1 Tax=Ramlibacter monticola TaxID=1926872 RepID=A0A936YYG3_9BURK|nr:HAMP domain-containing protein [Ramlibacter monticola]